MHGGEGNAITGQFNRLFTDLGVIIEKRCMQTEYSVETTSIEFIIPTGP